MKIIPIQIIRFVDPHQPGFVECSFMDAFGCAHYFVEKYPVVSKEEITADSSYPRSGILACEVVSTWSDENGRSLSKIDTENPWGIETKEGQTSFTICSELLSNYD
jgi:hypothetical protein